MAQSAEARVRAECRECYEIGGVPCPGRLPKDETPAQEALNRAAAEAWVKRDEDSMILLGRALQEHAMSRLPSPYVQAKAALSAPPTVQAGSDARETEIYQRWTAQVQHLKDAVLAYAKRLPYPYAGELLAEWERAAIAGPDLRPPRREEDAP